MSTHCKLALTMGNVNCRPGSDAKEIDGQLMGTTENELRLLSLCRGFELSSFRLPSDGKIEKTTQ